MKIEWKCESCNHTWENHPFVTYIICPKCGEEHTSHGNIILEEEDEYND